MSVLIKAHLANMTIFLKKPIISQKKISSVESNLQNFPLIVSELAIDAKTIGLLMNNADIDEAFLENEKLAMGDYLATLKDDPSEILKVLMDKLNESGLKLKIGTDMSVELILPSDTQNEQVTKMVDEFNKKLTNLFNNMNSIIENSKSIVGALRV